MHERRPAQRQALIAFVAIALLAGACGTSAPTTSATASPRAAATASAAASVAATPVTSASPAAAGSPGADPAAGLSIAAPYTLEPLDPTQAAQFEASLKAGLGALSSIVQVGARQVKKAGTNDGLVLAMAFPGVPVSNTSSFLDSVVGGAAGANGKVTSKTIEGQDVRLIEGTGTHVAAYLRGSTIVFAYGQAAAETEAIITAVIQASK
jgi:hypothetical protein